MSRRLFSWKLIFPGVVVAAVLAVVMAFAVVRSGESESDHGNEIHEALEHNPGLLNSHQLPLAYVAEKLAQQGGEASGEVANGPAQEAYDARAFPRHYIAPAQQSAAARAFATATARAKTAAGQSALKRAQGTSTAQGWTEMGPRGGIQASQTTYTGTRALVSGRTTSLAITSPCTASRCVLYAGAAGGGLWKTTSALSTTPRWVSIGADIPSTAIGTIFLSTGTTRTSRSAFTSSDGSAMKQ